MKIKPLTVLLAYLVIIISYACLYYFNPSDLNVEELSFAKSVYFSVVTITTLGYGEITPKTDLGMLIAGSEAIVGIVIIGLFLNSLWHFFITRLEKSQDESIKERISNQNLYELLSFYEYLETVLTDYQIAQAELTTPISKRQGIMEPNPRFIFSDMQDMFKSSLVTKSGFQKPVIHLYYEKLDNLAEELKFLISNFDLTEYPKIRKRIIKFLKMYRGQDLRNALFSYEEMGGGGELLKDTLTKLLKETDACPDPKDYASHVLTPAILLYQVLKFQVMEIIMLKKDFEELKANKSLKQDK